MSSFRFTDGRKGLNVLTNLDKTLKDAPVQNWANSLEKTITLVVIDDAWKEHLRAMDDLEAKCTDSLPRTKRSAGDL